MDEIIKVLLLQSGFNSRLVIIGTTFLGIAAGVVGSFALLRKRALMGDALAHSTLPGLVIAYIISVWFGFEGKNFIFLLIGAAVSGVVGVMVVQFLSAYTRLPEDSSIGAVLSIFFGIGVVLLSVVQSMESSGAAGLTHFIYGQTAAMRSFDAFLITLTAIAAAISAFFLVKEFTLVSFDPDFALVQGWPINKIDLLMMALVTVVTVIGLQSVGLILIIALLIIPAAAARFWTERLSRMVTLSAVIGGISGYAGAAASTLLPRMPAGAVIVITAGVIFSISFLFAPRRGVVVGLLRLTTLKFRVFKEHVFRDIYETYEKTGVSFDSNISWVDIPYLRALGKFKSKIVVGILAALGMLKAGGTEVSFTDKGLKHAARLVRNHRLWEQFIFEYAEISTSHVDYSADFAEHVLSPEIITKLEAKLSADAQKSIHKLGGA